MIYVNISFFLLLIGGYAVSRKGIKEWEKTIDRKVHKLYFLYPLAHFILTKTGMEKLLQKKEKVGESLKALNVTTKTEMIQRLYWCSKLSTVVLISFLFNSFSFVYHLQAGALTQILDGNYLMRPNHGDGSDEIELTVNMDRKETKENNSIKNEAENYEKDMVIEVEERSYTNQELKEVFEYAKNYIGDELLGENQSADNIYYNLNFSRSIPGTSISIEWQPEDYNLIDRNGKVKNEDIDSKGVVTTITAVLSYQEKKQEYIIPLRIMPKVYSKEEQLYMALKEEISTFSKKTSVEQRLELPQIIENYKLNWEEENPPTGTYLLIFGIFVSILVWIYRDQELGQQMKKRKEQLLQDYPEIINKFTLLVNAGMTVKQAWTKIVEDYEGKSKRYPLSKRFAYEEMIVTGNELKLGVSESSAYEQFGRRIRILPYMKFSSLIAQNLKKGSKGLSDLLNKEAIEAFEERKEAAKRMGEEAGTKLLVPMMMMLLIVLFIIIIPAFMSFGIS